MRVLVASHIALNFSIIPFLFILAILMVSCGVYFLSACLFWKLSQTYSVLQGDNLRLFRYICHLTCNSFTYLEWMWTRGFLIYSVAYNLLPLFILKSYCPDFISGSPVKLNSVSLTDPHHSLGTSSLWGTKCSRLILFIPYPRPHYRSFLQNALVLLHGGVFSEIKIGPLNTLIVDDFKPCQWSQLDIIWLCVPMDIYVYHIHWDIHGHKYRYVCYTYTYYIHIYVFTYISSSNTTGSFYFLHL